jgi:hypothetical protein
MLFDLSFELDEGHLGAEAHVMTDTRGVKRAGGQNEVQGKTIFRFSRNFLEGPVQLNKIRCVALEKFLEFCSMPISHLFERLAEFFLQIAEGNFHRSTRIVEVGSGLPPEGSCRYPQAEYSKLEGLAQPADGAGGLRFTKRYRKTRRCMAGRTAVTERSGAGNPASEEAGYNDEGRGGD